MPSTSGTASDATAIKAMPAAGRAILLLSMIASFTGAPPERAPATRTAYPTRLIQPAAVGDGPLGHDQHDLPVRVGEAEGEHLGHHLADLAGREVDHGG